MSYGTNNSFCGTGYRWISNPMAISENTCLRSGRKN